MQWSEEEMAAMAMMQPKPPPPPASQRFQTPSSADASMGSQVSWGLPTPDLCKSANRNQAFPVPWEAPALHKEAAASSPSSPSIPTWQLASQLVDSAIARALVKEEAAEAEAEEAEAEAHHQAAAFPFALWPPPPPPPSSPP